MQKKNSKTQKKQISVKARQNMNNKSKPNKKGRQGQGLRGPLTQRSAAAAYSTGQSSYSPIISATNTSSRIQHRELVGSVIGTAAYNVTSTNGIGQLALNPGIVASFPWLATQAVGWEQYHFNKLKFCYYTRTGSSTPGSVMLIPDYDAADAAPVSEQIASAYEDTMEDVPWKDIECILNPAAMHPDGPRKYVRTGALASNLDIKTYDVGNLFVATTDGTAVNWGKLWVEYDVTFHTPQLPPGGSASIGAFQSFYTSSPSSTNMVGASPSLAPGSANIAKVSGEVVTFLVAGTFRVDYYCLVSTSNTLGSISAGAGLTILTDASGDGTPIDAGSGGDTIQVVNVTTPIGGTLTYSNIVVGGTGAELTIIQVPPNYS